MSENLKTQSEEIKIPGLVNFRLCTLSDNLLLNEISTHLISMYKTGKLPPRHIPARPDEDFDLLVGELMVRYKEKGNEKIS